MRFRVLLLVYVMILSFRVAAQDDYRITWDYSGMSFPEFAEKAENVTGLRFFFRDEWVKELRPDEHQGFESLSRFLEELFRNKALFYFIDAEGNIVITKNFAIKRESVTVPGDTNYIAPSEYYGSGDEQKIAGNLSVDIGNPADRFRSGSVTLTGYITNRDTREPVAGATVLVQKLSTGTISNEYGFYTITLPRGAHLLQYSFLGMRERLVNLNLYGSGEMNIEMNSMLIPLKETVVSAERNVIFQRFEAGVEKVNITSFRLLPTSMGESDIIKSVLLIPGVQSVGEGSAGFNVRGGSSDQNLILLYGAPVYNSSHFFGFFSAVNSDVIKDVTLYKGGIPGRYGGRISSVMDITPRDGNRKEFAGNAGISPITAHLMLEGPIKKDTTTYLITARTTYSNWILGLMEDKDLKNSRASFYDINGRITHDINRNNRLEFSSYLSHDSFRFNSDTTYSYDNRLLSFKWRHFFNSRFFSNLAVNNSNYEYNVSGISSSAEGFRMAHSISSTGLKADFNLFQGRNEFNFGLDGTYYSVLPGNYEPFGDSSLVVPRTIPGERGLETAVYIDDKYVVTDYLSVNAGIRTSAFFAFGPASFPVYDPAFSRSIATITDTVGFSEGRIYKTYAGPELRLSANFRTGMKSSLKLNYNRTRQYLHLMSNTTSISPTDTWRLSGYYLRPQTGDQFALGFYHMLFNGKIETSAEVYYKRIGNMTDFKGGTDLVMNENIEKDIVNVKGKAYGLELAVRKDEGRVRWSLGYTYSRTFLRSIGKFRDEIINNGEWFPANFDKPNDLVATFNYLFSRRYSLSADYTWSTGRPVTYPVSTYYMGDIHLVHYSDRNRYRIPDYMRLDLSMKVSGNLRSRKIANPHWIFSVYNLLGRQNVYSVYFRNDGNTMTGYRLSVFGRAIPSVSFNFDF